MPEKLTLTFYTGAFGPRFISYTVDAPATKNATIHKHNILE